MNRGKERSEGDEGERRKGKGKLSTRKMETLVCVLRPSAAGANGIKPQHKLLILKSSALGAAGAPGSLLILWSYRQCFQQAFYRLIVHSEA